MSERAEHDAGCDHFLEAAWLTRATLQEDERVERLEAVAEAAVLVLRSLPHSGMCVAREHGPDRELLAPRCRCAPEVQALRAALADLESGA